MDTDRNDLERFIQHGDRQAMGALLQRHANLLYTVALRVMNNSADAEEVVQDVCLKAMAGASAYRGECSVKNWLLKIAFNLSLNRKRSRGRARERDLEAGGRGGGEPVSSDAMREASPVLEKAIAELEPALQAAVILHYYDRKTQVEIAEFLGCTQRTVHYRLDKAMDAIKGYFQRSGYMNMAPVILPTLQQGPLATAPSTLAAFIQTQVASAAISTLPAAAVAGITQTAGFGGQLIMNIKTFSITTAAVAALCFGGGYAAHEMAQRPALEQRDEELSQLRTATTAAEQQAAGALAAADARAREFDALKASLAEAETAAAAARQERELAVAERDAARHELETARAATASATHATEPVVAKPAKKKNPFGDLKAFMDDPNMREMMRNQQKQMMDMMYAEFIQSLNLTDEEKAAFKDMLFERQWDRMEAAFAMFDDTMTPEQKEEAKLKLQNLNGSHDEKLKEYLGADYEHFQYYEQTTAERGVVDSFSKRLPEGLDARRRDDIIRIMHEENKNNPDAWSLQDLDTSSGGKDFDEIMAKVTQPDFASTMLESRKAADDRIAERVGSVLSPAEREEFVKAQEGQRQMLEMSINMMSGMFGGGEETGK